MVPTTHTIAVEPDLFGPPLPPEQALHHSVQRLQSFARFRGQEPVDLGPSLTSRLFLGRRGPNLEEWFRDYEAIHPDWREAQVLYLRDPLENWLCSEVERPLVESRGVLALTLFVVTGLWQDFAHSGGRLFKSAHEFARYYLELWGHGASDSRVSRRLSSGRLWLRLRGEGLPVPGTLHRLEHFDQNPDAPKIYRDLWERVGTVPSEIQILIALGKTAKVSSSAAAGESRLAQLCTLAAEIHALSESCAEQLPPALREKIAELQNAAHPPTPVAKQPRQKKVFPLYDAALGCPFSFALEDDALHVTVGPLPHEWLVEVQKKARYAKWDCLLRGQTAALHVAVDAKNRSELRAKALTLTKWAKHFCARLKAPPPQPLTLP